MKLNMYIRISFFHNLSEGYILFIFITYCRYREVYYPLFNKITKPVEKNSPHLTIDFMQAERLSSTYRYGISLDFITEKKNNCINIIWN